MKTYLFNREEIVRYVAETQEDFEIVPHKPYSEWTVYELYAECVEFGMGEGEIGEVFGQSEKVIVDGILVAEYWYEGSEWFAKEYRGEGEYEISSIES